MKAIIIVCCIALAKGIWSYSFSSGGSPFGFGPWAGNGAGFGEFDHGGTTVVAGPTSIGFGRGHAVSTPRGTISTAVGKGIGTAPHNAGQVVKVGPITSVTSPLGSNHLTPAFFNGHGPFILDRKGHRLSQSSGNPALGGSLGFGGLYGLSGGYSVGGHGPWGGDGVGLRGHSPWVGHGIRASPDVVGAGTSASIGEIENVAATAVGSRVSGQHIGVSSSGTGRPVWTPHGQIGVGDSGSSSVTSAIGHFPYGGYSGGFGHGGGFGLGGDHFIGGGLGGHYPSIKKY